MVSYPQRARLKMYAEAEIIDIEADSELYEKLKPEDYKFRPEQMMIFKIKAYDWNCPQHITPRFTEAEISAAIQPMAAELNQLRAEIAALRSAKEEQ